MVLLAVSTATSESARPSGRPLKCKFSTCYASPNLFGDAHKQSAGQFAVCTDERRVVGLVVSTKNGHWPCEGVFLDQGFISRAIRFKFCIYGGLSIVHQGCFVSDKILTVIRKDTRVEFGLRQ